MKVFEKNSCSIGKGLIKKRESVERKEIIYSIPCSDCGKLYIGETKRGLEVRTKEHKKNVEKAHTTTSEIAKHCWEEGHRMAWQEGRALAGEGHWYKRKIKEAVISERMESFNNRWEISLAWKGLLL